MSTLAFDSLRYARRLREAGVPEPQADVQAELMAEAFGFYAANILTRDHFEAVLDAKLDARFAEQDARFETRFAAIDQRFTEIDQRFAKIDQRFDSQEAAFDRRFAELGQRFDQQDAGLDRRFDEWSVSAREHYTGQDLKFEARFAKLERVLFLHTWMLGLIVLVLVVPQLQAWLA